MSHSKFIVIKCPACGEKFDAQREEESSFLSCPRCAIQVKISGTHDRKRRSPRHVTPASSLPAKRRQEKVQFSDLAAGGADLFNRETVRKRNQKPIENEELIIDDDEEPAEDKPSADKPDAKKPVEDKPDAKKPKADKPEVDKPSADKPVTKKPAANKPKADKPKADKPKADKPKADKPKADEPVPKKPDVEKAAVTDQPESDKADSPQVVDRRAAKLEERAAKLAKLRAEREMLAKTKRQTSTEAAPGTEAKGAPAPSTADAASPENSSPAAKEPEEAEEEKDLDFDFEKVEVRSRGERLRLRQAPKAEVPEPRSRRVSAPYVDDLRRGKTEEAAEKRVAPRQQFENRKITEGSKWRRHQENHMDEPEWDSDEEPEKAYLYPSQRRRRTFIWTVSGLLGLFVIVAGYQFILAQIGWMNPTANVEGTSVTPSGLGYSWTNAEMLERVTPAIEAFLASNSNEEALQYVRRAGKVAGFMKEHYLPGSFEPVEFEALGPVEECEFVYGRFFRVPVNFKDRPSRDIYAEIPRSESSDEWLIDWESWEGYSEMGFNELRLRQPQHPVLIRCYLLQEIYYGGSFTNPKDYLSFKLWDHNQENQLWGYIDTLSAAYGIVVAELAGSKHSQKFVKVTLRVRFPEEVASDVSDQVEITDFVTLGWVITQ